MPKTAKRLVMPAWVRKSEGRETIAVCTRVRFARNLAPYKFPIAADTLEKEKIVNLVQEVTSHLSSAAGMAMIKLHQTEPLQRRLLAERSLIGMESAREPDQVAVMVEPGEGLSLLVNEEDHLRIQVLEAGLNLEGALARAQEFDESLSQALPLAQHKEFGFLTACPTNVGTGLRASVMLHLPALSLTRGIAQVVQAVLHMGLAVRGLYGEGTELRSVYFQVSNQVTLGRTEEEVIVHLKGVVQQIMEKEQEARQKLLKDEPVLLRDKVNRARGIVGNCQLLGFEEALDLLSTLRLGIETKIVAPGDAQALRELLLMIQPAHLQAASGKQEMNEAEELMARAEWVRKKLVLKPLAPKHRKALRKSRRKVLKKRV